MSKDPSELSDIMLSKEEIQHLLDSLRTRIALCDEDNPNMIGLLKLHDRLKIELEYWDE